MVVLASGGLGCASTGLSSSDGASVDGSRDGGAPDGALGVDSEAADAFAADAPACSCRSGSYHAMSTSGGLAYDFDLEECGGTTVCHLGLTTPMTTPCMMTSDGVFRVFIDTSGFVELVFSTTPCDAPWTGLYASEGGAPSSITATRR